MIEYYRIPSKAKDVSHKQIMTITDESQLKDNIHNKSIYEIKILNMKNSNINDQTISNFWTITNPLNIIEINMSQNFSFITDVGIEHLCQASSLSKLKSLHLADNSITDLSIQYLCRTNHMMRLEELILYGNSDISSQSLVYLAESQIVKNIKKLDLHDTSVCDKGLKYFVKSANSACLTHLDISMNSKRITDATFQAIATSAYCISLIELKAEDCLITDDGVSFLCETKNFEKLQTLNLNNSMKKKNNILTDECLRSVSFAKELTSLKKLQLRNSDITSKGINTLSVSLAASNLQILRFSHCQGIKDQAFRYLQAIIQYRSLNRLYINSTLVSPETCQKLSQLYPFVNIIY